MTRQLLAYYFKNKSKILINTFR